MIDRLILATAMRIRRRYAESFADLSHRKISPTMIAQGARAPTALAYPLSDALREARAIHRAADLGLTCETDAEDYEWDGDSPAPAYHLYMVVRDASGEVRASLGGIGVNSLSDPYLMTCEADLYAEAILDIEAEQDREATAAANALASRATYAGPSPEVQT